MATPSRQAQIEALIEAEVTRAMAPYRRLDLPAEVLGEMESLLRLGLRTHPSAQEHLRQLLPDPVLVRSDDVDTAGVDAQGEPLPRAKGEGA